MVILSNNLRIIKFTDRVFDSGNTFLFSFISLSLSEIKTSVKRLKNLRVPRIIDFF